MNYQNEHLTRQRDIIPMEILGEKITVIGAGAIGGWTTLALAKMGFQNLTVIDFDKVDTVNMNSQFFRFADIGSTKVSALQRLVFDFTETMITAKEERYESGALPGIVVAAVDSMEVRTSIYENHKRMGIHTRAIVDPRMGAQTALLYVVRPMVGVDQQWYEKTLYSDSEAVQERCSEKAVIYTANMLSGLVCKAIKDLLVRPDYLTQVQWDIARDDFLAFHHKVPTQ